MDGLGGFGAGVEAEKCGGIRSTAEEEEGGDGEGEEENGGDFEEIEGDPVREIEGFGFGEGIGEWDLFWVRPILDQHSTTAHSGSESLLRFEDQRDYWVILETQNGEEHRNTETNLSL